jgi:hypothetical protein
MGGVDCVYHIAFDELVAATESASTAEQKRVLNEMLTQSRLEDFLRLPVVLAA